MKTIIFLLPSVAFASLFMAPAAPHATGNLLLLPTVNIPANQYVLMDTPAPVTTGTTELIHVSAGSFDPIVTDVLTFTNKAREKKGLKPLVMKDALNDIARGHSENMASGKVPFSHDGFKERYAKARAEYTDVYSFGENVSFGPHTGKEAVEGWMQSKHHKDNILGDFTSIGIGVASDKKGVHYFTQVFCKE